MKRSPMPRAKRGLARRVGLAPMSPKRIGEKPARKRVVEQVRYRDGRCRAFGILPGRCGGPLDCHEIIPRSAWRDGYLVVDNCLLVCRVHHEWIGVHPSRAHDHGFHGYSYERPAA